MSDVYLRTARPEDASELTTLALASKRHWGYDESLMDLWRDELTFTPELIKCHIVIVAQQSDRLVGVVAISGHGDSRELEHLWVDPSQIRQGIGTRLFRQAVAEAAIGGASVLRISSDPNAEAFYLAVGAEKIGTVPSTPHGRHLPRLQYHIVESDPSHTR